MNNEQLSSRVVAVQTSLADLTTALQCDRRNCYCPVHTYLDAANDALNQTIVALGLTAIVTPYSLGLNLMLAGGSGPCATPTMPVTARRIRECERVVAAGQATEAAQTEVAEPTATATARPAEEGGDRDAD